MTLLTVAGLAQPSVSQAQQSLPGLVVQGATLAPPPTVVVAPKAEPQTKPAPKAAAKSASGPLSGSDRAAAPKASASLAAQSAAAAPVNSPAVTNAASGSGRSEGVSEAPFGGIAAEKIGTSVSIVTGEQLRQQGIRTAVDALRSLPGVSVSRTGGSQNLTVVRLRGGESNHTLVRIDGVDVNSGTDGIFDFANLAAEDIEQIEVLRGPQSGLYGGSALSGVINVITKAGKGPLTVRVRAEAGSRNTKDGAIQISGGNDRAHGSLTLAGRQSSGFNVSLSGDEADFAKLSTVSFNGGFLLLDNLKIDASVRRSVTKGGRDDGFGGVLANFSVPADDNSFFENGIWLGRVSATLTTLEGRLVHKLFMNRARSTVEDTNVGFFGTSFSESVSQSRKNGYSATYRLDGPSGVPVRHFITGLVEREEETFKQPTNLLGQLRERSRQSGAAEVRGEYFNNLFLSATVRHDDNSDFDDATTWRTSAAYKIANSPFRIHASYGTGIKYPSFGELFGFFASFQPNPTLKPETSRGYDAGIETSLLDGRAVVDVTYFNQNLTNEIDFRELPGFRYQPYNRSGQSVRSGVEVAGRFLLMPGLTTGLAYTYLDAENDDGTPEVRRAKHSGRVDVNWAFDQAKGNVNVAAAFNGTMKDVAFEAVAPYGTQLVNLKEYWLVTAGASYKLQPGVEVFGRVENLLNQRYQEVFGYNTPGTTAFAGLRLTHVIKPLD